ncbi:hypothetical protein Q7P37_009793 [Cladosporium fusiforme]
MSLPTDNQRVLQAFEHLNTHELGARSIRPADVDSTIASRYTGVDREYLRLIRKQCGYCNSGMQPTTVIELSHSEPIANLMMASRGLTTGSEPSSKSDSTEGIDRSVAARFFDLDKNPPYLRARYTSCVWIGCKDSSSAQISTQTLQHSYSIAAHSILVPSCFTQEEAAWLHADVGPDFLSMDHKSVTAHQSLVTASILADNRDSKVAFHTAEWLYRQLQQTAPSLSPNTLLMLAWRRYDSEDFTVRNIYKLLEGRAFDAMRIFPSMTELNHAHGKVGDIRALDDIARNAPLGWRFRPVTCDSESDCCLGAGGVLKRTYSCGSEHVILHPTEPELARYLRCWHNQRRFSKRQADGKIGRWFHQEFVEDLRTKGEFRVFIVTREDAAALRRRKGVIVEIIHTLELPDGELVVTVLHSKPTWAENHQEHDSHHLKELCDFAMYNFRALRSRADWSTRFESLEIGVRLDIGVSLAGGAQRYFVNEVTRIYEADFFAEWLAQPGTHVCRAVAKAIGEVFMGP